MPQAAICVTVPLRLFFVSQLVMTSWRHDINISPKIDGAGRGVEGGAGAPCLFETIVLAPKGLKLHRDATSSPAHVLSCEKRYIKCVFFYSTAVHKMMQLA